MFPRLKPPYRATRANYHPAHGRRAPHRSRRSSPARLHRAPRRRAAHRARGRGGPLHRRGGEDDPAGARRRVRAARVPADRGVARVDRADRGGDAPVFVVPDDVLDATTGYPVHRGALASFHRRPLPVARRGARRRPPGRRARGRERPHEPGRDLPERGGAGGRRGRADAARGRPAVPSRDPDARWARCSRSRGRACRGSRDRTCCATPGSRSSRSRPRPTRSTCATSTRAALDRAALAIGNEGDGLSERWLRAADLRVRIPMREGIDSLNAAAAAAVAFYALAPADRRRRVRRRERPVASRTRCPSRWSSSTSAA